MNSPRDPGNIPKGSGTPKVTPARRAAFEILTLVGENKGHSDELLHSVRTEALTPEDRNLATALVMGVLRWQIALDARIRTLLQRPEQRLAEPVALALRMGAFQLTHMDRIPAHAALSESVELCKLANQPHAAGMVNAILRKVAAAQKPGARIFESVPAFAERLGHPRWLVERWAALYGRGAALAICEADQQEPADGSMFTEAGGDLPQMDDGSRLVAELAAAAMPANATRIWDCCAAPGGKTLMLARRSAHAEIAATDVSARRLKQMEGRFRRYPYAEKIQCAVADATAPGDDRKFDLILCDVPCSGTGTLSRNPEIRHRLRVEELARQAERQRAILHGAFQRLAPGGRLVYSTCSLEPEENERVVEGLAGARRLPVEGLLAQLAQTDILQQDAAATLQETAVRDGALRTLPGVHGCDGFFAVVLERAES
ncbi:RsmB/NOP family class I SAM-dependent RNA methyltransferase [Granulicella arctica]|uniref:16S rRNA (Cytosine967-C5)-methyltransferase n=1 Tax=Granulicella arctica TaxID=940613 RepID=A0A7Y9PGJ5_9BACT|nr:transcription antitermination factor NusB [Granulicella arctica]NYF79505.1 16S rRNA (cytosine967-C5)-methyltransferase [Granulicella arctica]